MHRRTSPPDVAASNQRKLTHLRSQDPRLQTNPQRRRHTQTTRATTTPTTNTYPRRIIPRAKAGAQATTTTTTTSTAHWQRSACNAEEQPEQRALPVALDDEATTGRGPHNGPCLHHDAACARSRTAQPGVTTGSCEPRRVSTGARRGRGYSQASTLRDGSRLWGTRGTRHRVFFDGEGEDEDKDELEQGTRGVDDESGDVEGGGRRDDQREREAENEGRDGNGNDEGDGGVAGGVQSAKRGEAKGADGEDGKISSPRRRMGLGTQRTNATAQQSRCVVMRYALERRTSGPASSSRQLPHRYLHSQSPLANLQPIAPERCSHSRADQGQSVQTLSQTPHAVRMIRYAIYGSRYEPA